MITPAFLYFALTSSAVLSFGLESAEPPSNNLSRSSSLSTQHKYEHSGTKYTFQKKLNLMLPFLSTLMWTDGGEICIASSISTLSKRKKWKTKVKC